MKKEEVWRIIPLSRGYEISSYGNSRSKNGILKIQYPPKGNGYGYAPIYYTYNGKPKLHPTRIHILVAKAFPEICGEWFEGAVVDHIDGNKKNNAAYNLKVCTIQENNANPITSTKQKEKARQIGKEKIGENNPMFGKYGKDNPNSKPILCITNNTYYENAVEAAKILGLNANSIRRVCRGERMHHKGYAFIFINPDTE